MKNTKNIKDNPVVSIFLGEEGHKKEYELKCTHSVLKRFSSLRKCTIAGIEEELLSYDGISCLMYCMLTCADFSLTGEQIDEMLDDVPLTQIIELCGAAIAAAFYTGEEDDGGEADGDPTPAAEATGERA